MILGDFNLMRNPTDRNRTGGDTNNMLLFNTVIQIYDLEEIPLKGRSYTWSNMQQSPLLEKLDWVFTSANLTSEFPNTLSFPLSRLGSDHIPIHVQIGTDIPKANLFRFENYWIDFHGFHDTVSNCWTSSEYKKDSAMMINGKFKKLRYGLKKWSRNISNVANLITKCNFTLALVDVLEEKRILSTAQNKFQKILQEHTRKLTEARRIYWKNRAKIRWATLGAENTKYFHNIATKSYIRNLIT
jgi:hypothetical protein